MSEVNPFVIQFQRGACGLGGGVYWWSVCLCVYHRGGCYDGKVLLLGSTLVASNHEIWHWVVVYPYNYANRVSLTTLLYAELGSWGCVFGVEFRWVVRSW